MLPSFLNIVFEKVFVLIIIYFKSRGAYGAYLYVHILFYHYSLCLPLLTLRSSTPIYFSMEIMF